MRERRAHSSHQAGRRPRAHYLRPCGRLTRRHDRLTRRNRRFTRRSGRPTRRRGRPTRRRFTKICDPRDGAAPSPHERGLRGGTPWRIMRIVKALKAEDFSVSHLRGSRGGCRPWRGERGRARGAEKARAGKTFSASPLVRAGTHGVAAGLDAESKAEAVPSCLRLLDLKTVIACIIVGQSISCITTFLRVVSSHCFAITAPSSRFIELGP
jgi:hypothetical protein